MIYPLRVAGLTAIALLMSGCDEWEWGDSNRFKEDFHFSYTLKPGGKLSMENTNGSIEIMGWEKETIDISGTKYASTEDFMKGLKIDVVASDDNVRIRTIPPSGHRGNWGARYVIRVPFRADLERITSSNGAIKLDNVEGPARLRTSNGAVRIFRVKGNIEVETSNGGVEVTEHSGSLIARTSNGGIRADAVQGDFQAITSNGGINARFSDPQPGKTIRLESSNGSVNLVMDAIRDNNIRIATSNSSITLKLPASAKGQLKAHTSNSNVQTDFDVMARGQMTKTHVEGTINGGGPLIDLSTSNGSIRVLKL